MRVVNRSVFLSLPAGTIFCKFEPLIFGDLLIKGETSSNDFMYQSIADAVDYENTDHFVDLMDKAAKDGASVAMDFDCQSRDGLFDDNQLFAIWERQDVEGLIARLQKALSDSEAA